MSDYFDLGTYAREVTTESAHARLWFNRGLVWAYAFNHEEAAACFERAIEADPGCALAHWGLAYALGPNYNKPWEAFDEADLSASVSSAFTASRAAIEAAAEPVERALARALAARYPRAEPPPTSMRGPPTPRPGTRTTPTRCAVSTSPSPMTSMSPRCSRTR